MKHFILILLLCANAALCETEMSIEEFEAHATGRTFDFYSPEGLVGTERYLPDRHVEWAFEGQDCVFGEYFEWNGLVCFSYSYYSEVENKPQCWRMMRTDDGVVAQFFGEHGFNGSVQYMRPTSRKLTCAGPQVGV
jgi:hypothetical protein